MQPGEKTLDSLEVGWTSLLFERWSQPGTIEGFHTIGSPDQTVVLTTSGRYEIEVFSGGGWRRTTYGPGDGGATAPWNTNDIRWRSADSDRVETLHIYLPPTYFEEAAEEYRRAGRPTRMMHIDALALSDPFTFELAQSLASGVAHQTPNLHADGAARVLAVHLMLTAGALTTETVSRNPGNALTDQRLARVLEYIDHHFAEEITLDQLASEAGISRFHFVRLFRRRLSTTPYRYLVRRRLAHAQLLIKTTDLDVGSIAFACGYRHVGRFAAAFDATFGMRPSEFRRQLR